MPVLNHAHLPLNVVLSVGITVKALTVTAKSVGIWVVWLVIEHVTDVRQVLVLPHARRIGIPRRLSFPLRTRVVRALLVSVRRIYRASVLVVSPLLSLDALSVDLLVLELALRVLKTWNAPEAISRPVGALHQMLVPVQNILVVPRRIPVAAAWVIFGPIKIEQLEASLSVGAIELRTASGLGIKVMIDFIVLFIFLEFAHKCGLLLNWVDESIISHVMIRTIAWAICFIWNVPVVHVAMLIIIMIHHVLGPVVCLLLVRVNLRLVTLHFL